MEVKEAVMFDLDGVIVNSEPYWDKSLKMVFKIKDRKMDEEKLAQTVGINYKDVIEMLVREGDLEGDSEEIAELWINTLIEFFEKDPPEKLPGLDLVVSECKALNYRRAVASNSPRKYVEEILSKLGVMDSFEFYLTGEDVTKRKPDPQIYQVAAKKLGVRPSECIVVEDSRTGILSAKAAGMTVIAVPDSVSYEKITGADYKVRSLAEAIPILQKLRTGGYGR